MAIRANETALAAQARQIYVEALLRGAPHAVQGVLAGVRAMATQVAEPELNMRRRDLALDLPKSVDRWQRKLLLSLTSARGTLQATRTPGAPPARGFGSQTDFALVDDDTIEREILGSRMALAMMDAANWQFSDLRSRLAALEGKDELDTHDILRPHVLAKYVVEGWLSAGLTMGNWRTAQAPLHKDFSHLIEEAYHETNRWLLERGVRPEIDLRPFIRRATEAPGGGGGGGGGATDAGGATSMGRQTGVSAGPTQYGGGGRSGSATGVGTTYRGRPADADGARASG